MPPISPSGRERTLRRDDRAVSTVLGYVLSLAITSLLISGLMFAAGGYVEDQREQVVREELEVVGQTLIADIEGADRLAVALESSTNLKVKSALPRRVGSSAYSIEITSGVNSQSRIIELSASTIDVTVSVFIVTTTTLEMTTVDGGELVVVYDPGDAQLEVREA